MSYQVKHFDDARTGLLNFGEDTPSFRDNIRARIAVGAGEELNSEQKDLWNIHLDSKTVILWGFDEIEQRYGFKVDHSFPIQKWREYSIFVDGSLNIEKKDFECSEGRLFYVVNSIELQSEGLEVAIRADKYRSIKEKLAEGTLTHDEIYGIGGFPFGQSAIWIGESEVVANPKLGEPRTQFRIGIFPPPRFTPEQILQHDGWLELAVGENNANLKQYQDAAQLLKWYIFESKKTGHFSIEYADGLGMAFAVVPESDEYSARSWVLEGSPRSWASLRDKSNYDGWFVIPKN